MHPGRTLRQERLLQQFPTWRLKGLHRRCCCEQASPRHTRAEGAVPSLPHQRGTSKTVFARLYGKCCAFRAESQKEANAISPFEGRPACQNRRMITVKRGSRSRGIGMTETHVIRVMAVDDH